MTIQGWLKYMCPFGNHSRPKLELSEFNGYGRFKCWACGMDGDIFTLHAHLNNLNVKHDFLTITQEVAQLLGYFSGDGVRSSRPRQTKTYRKAAPLSSERTSEPPVITKLTAEQELKAWQAVKRIHEPSMQTALQLRADELGLPVEALTSHAVEEFAWAGLLGMDEKGALLYIYTSRDEAGVWRVTAVKRRAIPHEIKAGQARFTAWKGSSKQALWGASLLPEEGVCFVIITEGESDAIVLRYSLLQWHEHLLRNHPDVCPAPELIPLVVAKPDAGSFKVSWSSPLKGADVILLVDKDEAGHKGAAQTAELLHQAGVHSVKTWHARGKAKDPRAAFDAARSWLLFEDIIQQAQNAEKPTAQATHYPRPKHHLSA